MPNIPDLLRRIPDIDASDFTVYAPADPGCPPGDYTVTIEPSNQPARVCVCSCRRGELLSVTVRRIGKAAGANPALRQTTESYPEVTGFLGEDAHTHSPKFFDTIAELSKAVYGRMFLDESKRVRVSHGLVVIFGATETGKTTLAKAIIHFYLQACAAGQARRRPHLVTFEDPIEGDFLPPPEAIIQEPFREYSAIDYTPRQKDDDAADLNTALTDALRQTPALFYAGETRESKDLNALLEFAKTGHLVVTTAHSGSLSEGMAKILTAAHAQTAAARGTVARTLAGVVHLISQTENGVRYTAPAIWRATPAAQMSLTSDGLGSVLPHRPRSVCSLGRASVMTQLLSSATGDVRQKILLQATRWDLEGV